MDMRSMKKDIKEMKKLMWNTYYLVEDIQFRVGCIEEAMNFNQDESTNELNLEDNDDNLGGDMTCD